MESTANAAIGKDRLNERRSKIQFPPPSPPLSRELTTFISATAPHFFTGNFGEHTGLLSCFKTALLHSIQSYICLITSDLTKDHVRDEDVQPSAQFSALALPLASSNLYKFTGTPTGSYSVHRYFPQPPTLKRLPSAYAPSLRTTSPPSPTPNALLQKV